MDGVQGVVRALMSCSRRSLARLLHEHDPRVGPRIASFTNSDRKLGNSEVDAFSDRFRTDFRATGDARTRAKPAAEPQADVHLSEWSGRRRVALRHHGASCTWKMWWRICRRATVPPQGNPRGDDGLDNLEVTRRLGALRGTHGVGFDLGLACATRPCCCSRRRDADGDQAWPSASSNARTAARTAFQSITLVRAGKTCTRNNDDDPHHFLHATRVASTVHCAANSTPANSRSSYARSTRRDC